LKEKSSSSSRAQAAGWDSQPLGFSLRRAQALFWVHGESIALSL
jgi:hypothetical protein